MFEEVYKLLCYIKDMKFLENEELKEAEKMMKIAAEEFNQKSF